ncbi:FkbM family methyltransferase [Nostoc sp. CHAB 5844]|nr:FkbM family methyltransferase [Nostoc sp. CHAB 5844]
MLKKLVTLDHALIDLLYKKYNHSYWAKTIYPFLLRQRIIIGAALYQSRFCPAPTSPTRWIASLLQPGEVFIDGGGHAGLMSMIASVCVGNEGQVHTFEPQSELVERLRLDISAGQFSNINLNQKLLAEHSGKLLFFQIPGATVTSSVSPLLSSCSDAIKIECPATSLDDYWNSLQNSKPIDLIKLDVEGYELAVIRGCKNLIQAYHPVIILEVAYSEDWPTAFGYSLDDLLAYISELGYKSYSSQDFKFFLVNDKSDIKSENLLCIHKQSRLYRRAMNLIE